MSRKSLAIDLFCGVTRDELFNSNLSWAHEIARKEHKHLPPSFDLEDLQQVAAIEHWKRSGMYDAARNDSYQGYAYRAVRGAVLMACRRKHWTAATSEELPLNQVDEAPSAEEVLISRQEAAVSIAELDERRTMVLNYIRLIPQERWWEAYLLRRVYLDGEDLRELAAKFEMEYAGLARRLAIAVRYLKKERGTR